MIVRSKAYRRFVAAWLDAIMICVSVAVAAFFLFHRIGSVPPLFPWSDESEIAADAVQTLALGPQLVYPDQLAGGSLAVYLETVFIAVFGRSLLGLRILNALLNISLVAMTYILARRMFASQGKLFSQLVAGLTCLWLASSTWLLAMGRMATPNWPLMPLMTVICVYLLWRALETRQGRYFASSGLVLGLSFYGYVPGLFVPVMLATFLAVEWLVSRVARRPSLLKIHAQRVGWLVLAMALAALPLLLYFLFNPEPLLQRPAQIVTVNQAFSFQRLFVSLGEIIVNFGLSLYRSSAGQTDASVLDPLTGLLFIAGVVAALTRLRQRAQLFLLIWWGTLILPAALSSASAGFELMRRSVGAEPVTFMFPALGLVTIGQWVRSRYPRFISIAGPALATLLVAFSALMSYEYYFWDWATGTDIPQLFAQHPVCFVEWLKAEATPDMVYIFPIRPGVSPTTRPELFTVRYLYDGQAPVAYPVVDDTTLPAILTDVSAGKSVVRLLLPERGDIDPKGYVDFLLRQHARELESESRSGYTIKTYRLKSSSEKFEAGGSVVTTRVDFGGIMRLVDYTASSAALAAGERIWLTMHWTKLLDTAQDYSVGLALVNEDGYAIAQADKLLLSDTLNQGTSHWKISESAADYYVLDIPAYAPPGDYALDVVVYAPNGERLMPSGGHVDLSLRLAEIRVTPSVLPVDPAGLAIEKPVDKPVTPALRLAGMDLSQTVVQPGNRVDLTLMWQAIDAPQQDYELIVGLTGEDGPVYATGPQPLVSASYPTNQWRRGEVLQGHYTLLPPPNLESGDYILAIRLVDQATGKPVSDQVLQPLTVKARPHSFAAPSMSHPVEVNFGDLIGLIGYDQPTVSADGQVRVRVYWQALAEMSESYKVFAHVTDSSGSVVAQSDFIPGNGAAPTTSWVAGEIISDTIRASLPEAAGGGTYHLVVGLYSGTSGARLPLDSGEDSWTLSEITKPK
jgi:4-amino-4-deoxy-L-arabinose transferase-like glycosyltransferase